MGDTKRLKLKYHTDYQRAIKGTAYELYRATRKSNYEYIATISEDLSRFRVSPPRTSEYPNKGAVLRWDWVHISRRAILHSHTECGARGFSETDEKKIARIDRIRASLGYEALLEWYVVDWDGNVWFWDREKGAGVLFGSVHNR